MFPYWVKTNPQKRKCRKALRMLKNYSMRIRVHSIDEDCEV